MFFFVNINRSDSFSLILQIVRNKLLYIQIRVTDYLESSHLLESGLGKKIILVNISIRSNSLSLYYHYCIAIR